MKKRDILKQELYRACNFKLFENEINSYNVAHPSDQRSKLEALSQGWFNGVPTYNQTVTAIKTAAYKNPKSDRTWDTVWDVMTEIGHEKGYR